METQMTSPRFLSPAETARRLGVSVRALRLYERRDLVRPRRTGAGWRVYGPEEMARLHQVLALKSLGLPLRRIAELAQGRIGDLDAILALQERALSARRSEIDRALKALGDARGRIGSGRTLSLDDLVNLSRDTAMNPIWSTDERKRESQLAPIWRKHLTPEQYEKFFTIDPDQLAEFGLDEAGLRDAWQEMIAEAQRLMRESDARDPKAADLLRRWQKLQEIHLKGDMTLAVSSTHAQFEALTDPDLAPLMPVSIDLIAFFQEVALKQGLGSPAKLKLRRSATVRDGGPERPTAAVVRGAVDSLLHGTPRLDRMTPELAAIAGPQTPMFQKLMKRLGALKSIAFEGESEHGDVYWVSFEEAALRCILRLNDEGKIAGIAWQGA
jgi:DNA-binding transcriptional MerR regulator